MKTFFKFTFILILFTSCGENSTSEDNLQEYESIDLDSSVSFVDMDDLKDEIGENEYPEVEDLMELYDTIYIDNKIYFIMEGDLLLSKNPAIENWVSKKLLADKSRMLQGEIRNGEVIKASNPSNIHYAIIQHSFPNKQYYDSIVKFFTTATNNWKELCNVKFIHESNRDATLSYSDNPNDLDFVIRYQGNNPKAPLASAFFPYSPKNEKRVLIFNKFFNAKGSKIGILRHEIGHILGFRHEHIRNEAPAGCGKYGGEDDLQYIEPITKYDNVSVMHYFCGGAGTQHLNFSKLDTLGARAYYPFKK